MEMVTLLVVGSTAYVLFGTLLESIFFNLYNSSFHPFAKILDISEDPQGRSLNLLLLLGWPCFGNFDENHHQRKIIKFVSSISATLVDKILDYVNNVV